MSIEATIMIDAEDDQDIREIVMLIQRAVSGINGQETDINVNEIDNPTSFSPLALKRMRNQWQK